MCCKNVGGCECVVHACNCVALPICACVFGVLRGFQGSSLVLFTVLDISSLVELEIQCGIGELVSEPLGFRGNSYV